MSGETSSSEPEFTLFPKLPIELRYKIWEQMLPGPRIIEIRYESQTNEFFTFAKPLTQSKVLHICKESRGYALGKYTLLEFENDVDVDAISAFGGSGDMKDADDDGESGDDNMSGNEGPEEESDNEDGSDSEPMTSFDRDRYGDYLRGVGAESSAEDIDNIPGEKTSNEDEDPTPPFRAYVDFSRDTLYFGSEHLYRAGYVFLGISPSDAPLAAFLSRLTELPGITSKVRHVALAIERVKASRIAPALFELKDLQSITIVHGDTCCHGLPARETGPCIYHKPSPRFEHGGKGSNEIKTTRWPARQVTPLDFYETQGQELKAELEEAIKNYKASPQYEKPDSVEEWKDLEMRVRWIKREFASYRMEAADDASECSSDSGSEQPSNLWHMSDFSEFNSDAEGEGEDDDGDDDEGSGGHKSIYEATLQDN